MLNVFTPFYSHHWLPLVKMSARELQAKVPGMARRDFRVTVPNSHANTIAEAQRELAAKLQHLADELDNGQPVRIFGAMIPAPEGAAAILRVMAMPDAEGYYPEAVHKAVFATFETTVTALDNHCRYGATHLIDLAAGTDLLEGVA